MLSSVLLPQPLGPISATTSPSATEKLTPSIAVTVARPFAAGKRIVTSRYSSRFMPGLEGSFPHLAAEYRLKAYPRKRTLARKQAARQDAPSRPSEEVARYDLFCGSCAATMHADPFLC